MVNTIWTNEVKNTVVSSQDELLDGIVKNSDIFQKRYRIIERCKVHTLPREQMKMFSNVVIWLLTNNNQSDITSGSVQDIYKSFTGAYIKSSHTKNPLGSVMISALADSINNGATIDIQDMVWPVDEELPTWYYNLDEYLENENIELSSFIDKNKALLEAKPISVVENHEEDIAAAKNQL